MFFRYYVITSLRYYDLERNLQTTHETASDRIVLRVESGETVGRLLKCDFRVHTGELGSRPEVVCREIDAALGHVRFLDQLRREVITNGEVLDTEVRAVLEITRRNLFGVLVSVKGCFRVSCAVRILSRPTFPA